MNVVTFIEMATILKPLGTSRYVSVGTPYELSSSSVAACLLSPMLVGLTAVNLYCIRVRIKSRRKYDIDGIDQLGWTLASGQHCVYLI